MPTKDESDEMHSESESQEDTLDDDDSDFDAQAEASDADEEAESDADEEEESDADEEESDAEDEVERAQKRRRQSHGERFDLTSKKAPQRRTAIDVAACAARLREIAASRAAPRNGDVDFRDLLRRGDRIATERIFDSTECLHHRKYLSAPAGVTVETNAEAAFQEHLAAHVDDVIDTTPNGFHGAAASFALTPSQKLAVYALSTPMPTTRTATLVVDVARFHRAEPQFHRLAQNGIALTLPARCIPKVQLVAYGTGTGKTVVALAAALRLLRRDTFLDYEKRVMEDAYFQGDAFPCDGMHGFARMVVVFANPALHHQWIETLRGLLPEVRSCYGLDDVWLWQGTCSQQRNLKEAARTGGRVAIVWLSTPSEETKILREYPAYGCMAVVHDEATDSRGTRIRSARPKVVTTIILQATLDTIFDRDRNKTKDVIETHVNPQPSLWWFGRCEGGFCERRWFEGFLRKQEHVDSLRFFAGLPLVLPPVCLRNAVAEDAFPLMPAGIRVYTVLAARSVARLFTSRGRFQVLEPAALLNDIFGYNSPFAKRTWSTSGELIGIIEEAKPTSRWPEKLARLVAQLEGEGTCPICLETTTSTNRRLFACCYGGVCTACSERLRSQGRDACPMCRSPGPQLIDVMQAPCALKDLGGGHHDDDEPAAGVAEDLGAHLAAVSTKKLPPKMALIHVMRTLLARPLSTTKIVAYLDMGYKARSYTHGDYDDTEEQVIRSLGLESWAKLYNGGDRAAFLAFRDGDGPSILFLNSMNHQTVAGLDLKVATAFVASADLSDDMRRQLVGRALRSGHPERGNYVPYIQLADADE